MDMWSTSWPARHHVSAREYGSRARQLMMLRYARRDRTHTTLHFRLEARRILMDDDDVAVGDADSDDHDDDDNDRNCNEDKK